MLTKVMWKSSTMQKKILLIFSHLFILSKEYFLEELFMLLGFINEWTIIAWDKDKQKLWL